MNVKNCIYLIMVMAFGINSNITFASAAAESITSEQQKRLADGAFGEHDWESALFHYWAAIQLESVPGKALYRNYAMAAYNIYDFERAEVNLKKALKIDAHDAKTLYWLGKTHVAKNELTKAIYFLRQAAQLDSTPKSKSLLTSAESKFEALCNNVEATPAFLLGPKVAISLKMLGARYADRVGAACTQAEAKRGFVDTHLEHFWGSQNFVPLARMEDAGIIAKILEDDRKSGGEKEGRLATVIVQTLPELASATFRDVKIYDTSKAQIEFHKKSQAALKAGSHDTFVKQAETEFKEYVQSHLQRGSLDERQERQIRDAFRAEYKPLANIGAISNIVAEQKDIFEAVNNEQPQGKHDVVFISTIPSLTIRSWPTNYSHIRNWVLAGKTVVFCLLSPVLSSKELLQEVAYSFHDVAKVAYICPEETPLLVYVKLSPL